MIHKTEFTIAGKKVTLEIGRLAQQADSAVLARCGETVVLAAVTASKKESSLSYFPLSVDYEEKLYSGGRIKGSRWVKRGGRPADELILRGRLIDRSIRPLFPKAYKHDVQVIVNVLSHDLENDPDMLSMIAVSAALSLCQVPWNGPIGAVRMGMIEGALIVNPTLPEQDQSDLDLFVSASEKKVVMLEAGGNQVPEAKMFEAIVKAHEMIQTIIKAVADFAKEHGVKKQEVSKLQESELYKELSKAYKKEIVKLMTAKSLKKDGSEEAFNTFFDDLVKKYEEAYTGGDIFEAIDTIYKKHMRATILSEKKRVDGRGLKDLRELYIETPILPRTHGSAIFQRGNTQALTITTLGSPSLEQLLESAVGEESKRYIHHYNMPPFSVGETGRYGFTSRREIGHGALAERALEPVIPPKSEFPYTIHVVSEVLSSNGSTSMASTCGSTLSLMDAGVPIKKPVAGISIGLVTEGADFELLTDIMGVEDFNGDMDFKVAGTDTGITAIQLDVKVDGLTHEMIEQTFVQAREARMYILERMNAVIAAPRSSISKYAPKIEMIHIPVEKIGEIIGPGGKIIKSIIAETGCDVNVEDDGSVTVAGQDADKMKRAIDWIKSIVKEVEVDEEYDGTVVRMMPFGAFVEILPGKDGLVHLSKMSTEYVNAPEDVVQIGQTVHVRVIEIDSQGRINLSMLAKGEERERSPRPSSGPHDRGGRDSYRGDRDQKRDNRRGGGFLRGRRDQNPRNRPYQHPHLKEQ